MCFPQGGFNMNLLLLGILLIGTSILRTNGDELTEEEKEYLDIVERDLGHDFDERDYFNSEDDLKLLKNRDNGLHERDYVGLFGKRGNDLKERDYAGLFGKRGNDLKERDYAGLFGKRENDLQERDYAGLFGKRGNDLKERDYLGLFGKRGNDLKERDYLGAIGVGKRGNDHQERSHKKSVSEKERSKLSERDYLGSIGLGQPWLSSNNNNGYGGGYGSSHGGLFDSWPRHKKSVTEQEKYQGGERSSEDKNKRKTDVVERDYLATIGLGGGYNSNSYNSGGGLWDDDWPRRSVDLKTKSLDTKDKAKTKAERDYTEILGGSDGMQNQGYQSEGSIWDSNWKRDMGGMWDAELSDEDNKMEKRKQDTENQIPESDMTEREKRGDRWLVGKRDTANQASERDVMMEREKRGDRWLVGKRDTANQKPEINEVMEKEKRGDRWLVGKRDVGNQEPERDRRGDRWLVGKRNARNKFSQKDSLMKRDRQIIGGSRPWLASSQGGK